MLHLSGFAGPADSGFVDFDSEVDSVGSGFVDFDSEVDSVGSGFVGFDSVGSAFDRLLDPYNHAYKTNDN